MVDRGLPGILLMALVGSSMAYLALAGGGQARLSVLEVKVPERMYFSEEEYHVIASVVAEREIAQVDLRLHWLRGVGEDALAELKQAFGHRPGVDAKKALELIPMLSILVGLADGLGVEPTILDGEIPVDGLSHRLIVFSLGPVQEAFMPDRIGSGEGRRPIAAGDYALLLNGSGHLVNVYAGYPCFFYDVEQTLISLEVDIDRQKSVYQNRTPESSLPLLRDLPLIGSLKLPLSAGQRLDLLISIEGRSLLAWAPRLCVVEIRVDGSMLEFRSFRT